MDNESRLYLLCAQDPQLAEYVYSLLDRYNALYTMTRQLAEVTCADQPRAMAILNRLKREAKAVVAFADRPVP